MSLSECFAGCWLYCSIWYCWCERFRCKTPTRWLLVSITFTSCPSICSYWTEGECWSEGARCWCVGCWHPQDKEADLPREEVLHSIVVSLCIVSIRTSNDEECEVPFSLTLRRSPQEEIVVQLVCFDFGVLVSLAFVWKKFRIWNGKRTEAWVDWLRCVIERYSGKRLVYMEAAELHRRCRASVSIAVIQLLLCVMAIRLHLWFVFSPFIHHLIHGLVE